MKKVFAISVSMIGLSACTTDVPIAPSSVAAGAVMADRVIKTPTTYTFAPDMADRGIVFTLGAYTYKSNVGHPMEETLVKATQAGFSNATSGPGNVRAPYNIRFDIDDTDGHLSVIQGFLSASVNAHIELSATVDVTDITGKELAKAEIVGSGSATGSGNSDGIQQAIKLAGQKAMKKIGEDYVFKIINTNTLH